MHNQRGTFALLCLFLSFQLACRETGFLTLGSSNPALNVPQMADGGVLRRNPVHSVTVDIAPNSDPQNAPRLSTEELLPYLVELVVILDPLLSTPPPRSSDQVVAHPESVSDDLLGIPEPSSAQAVAISTETFAL